LINRKESRDFFFVTFVFFVVILIFIQ